MPIRAAYHLPLLVITAVLQVYLCNPAQATEGQQYLIAPQDLSTAISQLSEQADLEINYPAALVQGLKSPGLNGDYTGQDALNRLLKGTGLRAKVAPNHAYTLEKAAVPLIKVNSVDDGKTQQQPELEGSEGQVMPKVTVEADSAYDPEYYADPYNKDYVIPNATAGTKTDTPIMETPLNVQVISKQVLKDQQVITLDQVLKNVSGVTTANQGFTGGGDGGIGTGQSLFLRGIQTNAFFRDGFRLQ
ncbi:MAG: TonB-dependent receptor [Methylococcaceae bacterium]|nr:TonB-dependent receptor [Methylococcaceae bacterium]